ncbi:MAG: dCTP deaminase [Elusimicrobia bacterium]|nr:dCTP deaminase [Elusimicrobiota bacterium]
MPVKSDNWIVEKSRTAEMIRPFEPGQVKTIEWPDGKTERALSFGTSSYGYDMRLGTQFRRLRPAAGRVIDPKNHDEALFEPFETDRPFELGPHGLVLAQTMEYFKIPRDILTICFGKSTYARCGVLVNVTPFEPEWEGFATIAISNLTGSPVRLYPREGIAQLIFLQADEVCAVSYADKAGKYQAQKGITAAKV